MHVSSILSSIAKGLNTYVNKIFQLFYYQKTCFRIVIMAYNFKIDDKNKHLINFKIRL